MTRLPARAVALVALALSSACGSPPEPPASLKTAFDPHFLVGAALNDAQVSGRDSIALSIVPAEFNSATPENVLKWALVHPRPDSFAFDAADRFVAFGEEHGMFIVGHTLVWHQQTPRWVFEEAPAQEVGVTREVLLARLEDHITTVVGRYRGRIHAWDVVNEALAEDGSLRDTPWRRIIGDDYIARAFEFARAADPDAQLLYNDYSLANAAKRRGAIALIERLRAEGIEVDGIGEQGHYKMDWPSALQFDSTVVELSGLGIPVHVTELDIDLLPFPLSNRSADLDVTAESRAALDPWPDALPDSMQAALAERYAGLFGVLVARSHSVFRVTFWGVTDGPSWLNNWPIPGRTSHPLLFDRAGSRKAAYGAVLAAAR